MPLELVHELIDSKRYSTENVAALCTMVRNMVPQGSRMGIDQKKIFLAQLETFPCSTHQERMISATAIATWAMLNHICNR